MTYQQALNAMVTGEQVRYRGYHVIVAGVEQKRVPRIDGNGMPYCIGEPFYSCRLLGRGSSGGTVYWGRPEEIMTEAEYQGTLKGGTS